MDNNLYALLILAITAAVVSGMSTYSLSISGTGATGPDGQSSVTGPTGRVGDTGTSSDQPGPAGVMGGITGPTGRSGGTSTVTGPRGPTGPLSLITGATGMTGGTGNVGYTLTGTTFSYHFYTDATGQYFPTAPTQLTGTMVVDSPISFMAIAGPIPTSGNTNALKMVITSPSLNFPPGTSIVFGSLSDVTYPLHSKIVGTRDLIATDSFELGFVSPTGVFTPLTPSANIAVSGAVITFMIIAVE